MLAAGAGDHLGLKPVKPLGDRRMLDEIVLTLANRPEIPRGKLVHRTEARAFRGCQFRFEVPAEEDLASLFVQVVEGQLEREPPLHGGVERCAEIGRGDKDAVELFHLLKQLVDLRELPTMFGTFARAHSSARFPP